MLYKVGEHCCIGRLPAKIWDGDRQKKIGKAIDRMNAPPEFLETCYFVLNYEKKRIEER